VTMVNETAFADNNSQWVGWKQDKTTYAAWLDEKIQHVPERSHGFRFRGQYQEQVPQELANETAASGKAA